MSILSFAVAWRRSYLLGIQSKPAKEEDINSTENGKVSNKQQLRQDQDSIFKNQRVKTTAKKLKFPLHANKLSSNSRVNNPTAVAVAVANGIDSKEKVEIYLHW